MPQTSVCDQVNWQKHHTSRTKAVLKQTQWETSMPIIMTNLPSLKFTLHSAFRYGNSVTWGKVPAGELPHIPPLYWRHNDHDGVSNHQPHGCLLSPLFRRRSKKTSKLRVTGLCAGKFTGTGKFPAQRANNAENVSIWWRHHAMPYFPTFAADSWIDFGQWLSLFD